MRTPLFAVNVLVGLCLQSIIMCLPANGGTNNYTYDIMGQLTKVEYPDGTVIIYTYDKMGNRQSRVTSVTATAPPTVTTGSATGVTGYGAILNATVVPNNLDTTVTFEYGLTTAYGTTIAASQNPVTGTVPTAVSRTIIGLTTGSVYHYRAAAVNAKGTAYGSDKTFTATGTSYYTVVVGTAGTGSGTFSSSSPMIGCGTVCSGVLMGSSAVISVTPNSGSYLSGWSGCDSVNGNNCTINPNADKNVTATVDLYTVARVGTSTTTYSLKIQDAFTAATSGDTIKILALGVTENLVFSNNATVNLKGGFAPGFTSNTGYTTLNGTLKISGGKLTVEKIVLR